MRRSMFCCGFVALTSALPSSPDKLHYHSSNAPSSSRSVGGSVSDGPGGAERFLQCDPRWGNVTMGVKGPGEQASICREGCAMTSLTMALHDLGLYINDTQLDPGVMNAWLQANDGYVCDAGDCNNLVLDAPERIPGSPLVFLGEKEKPAVETLAQWVNSSAEVLLAHVDHSGHFVLLRPSARGAEGVFEVLDPYFNRTTYEYGDISDVIHYHVERKDGVMDYPTYKQCDDRWGDHIMGANNDTVCEVGCLMSSVSEALYGHGIEVNGTAAANPGSLNDFLRATPGGYDDSSDLNEDAVPLVDPQQRVAWPADGMHRTNDLTPDEVAEYLGIPTAKEEKAEASGAHAGLRGTSSRVSDSSKKHRVVIANVLHGGHFVLVQGLGGKNASGPEASVFVHDSGFARGIYSFSEVVGWRIFDMVEKE